MYENLREFAQTLSQTSAFFSGTFIFSALFLIEKKGLTLRKFLGSSRWLRATFFILMGGIGFLLYATVAATILVSNFKEGEALQVASVYQLQTTYYEAIIGIIGSLLGLMLLAFHGARPERPQAQTIETL